MAERSVPVWLYLVGYLVALAAATGAWLLVVVVRGNVLLTLVLSLALVQGAIVVLCFMDLAVQPASNRLAMIGALVMVALLVFLTALDPLTRDRFPAAPAPPVSARQPAPASP